MAPMVLQKQLRKSREAGKAHDQMLSLIESSSRGLAA
jgi:hypothetical protein